MNDRLELKGVQHSARPTWKLRETVEFYRDKLGLELVHCVSAKGWGVDEHPDFIHFFFDSGLGSTIAFFYYIGNEQAPELVHQPRFDHDANHTSWQVENKQQLDTWQRRLESQGIDVMYRIEHEVVESIYFRDPNGYYLEIGYPLRELTDTDKLDANLSIEAAIQLEDQWLATKNTEQNIETVWRHKGELVEKHLDGKV